MTLTEAIVHIAQLVAIVITSPIIFVPILIELGASTLIGMALFIAILELRKRMHRRNKGDL